MSSEKIMWAKSSMVFLDEMPASDKTFKMDMWPLALRFHRFGYCLLSLQSVPQVQNLYNAKPSFKSKHAKQCKCLNMKLQGPSTIKQIDFSWSFSSNSWTRKYVVSPKSKSPQERTPHREVKLLLPIFSNKNVIMFKAGVDNSSVGFEWHRPPSTWSGDLCWCSGRTWGTSEAKQSGFGLEKKTVGKRAQRLQREVLIYVYTCLFKSWWENQKIPIFSK